MKPSVEYIKECFRYCEKTGVIYWKDRPSRHFIDIRQEKRYKTRVLGSRAGNIHYNPKGMKHYIRVNVCRTGIFAHHIVWAMNNGEWPDSIDHIDGNGRNNRIGNLRLAGSSENMKNLKMYSNNKTGITGVYNYSGKYRAKIRVGNDLKHLGSFNNIFDAACARISAEKAYGFHENHGKQRPRY